MIISLGGVGLKLNLNLYPLSQGNQPDYSYQFTGDAGDFARMASLMGHRVALLADIAEGDIIGEIIRNYAKPDHNVNFYWNVLNHGHNRACHSGIKVVLDHYQGDVGEIQSKNYVDITMLGPALSRGAQFVHIAGRPYFPLTPPGLLVADLRKLAGKRQPSEVPGKGSLWYIQETLSRAKQNGFHVSIDAGSICFMLQTIKAYLEEGYGLFSLIEYLTDWVSAIYIDEVSARELTALCTSDTIVEDLARSIQLLMYTTPDGLYYSHDGQKLKFFKKFVKSDDSGERSRLLYGGLCVNYLLNGMSFQDSLHDANERVGSLV